MEAFFHAMHREPDGKVEIQNIITLLERSKPHIKKNSKGGVHFRIFRATILHRTFFPTQRKY